VASSASGDAVVNPHERGVIAHDPLSSLGIMRAAADALEAMLWMWTLDFGTMKTADARLRAEARGRDGGVRQEIGGANSVRGQLSYWRNRHAGWRDPSDQACSSLAN
jgi:hypothetical protein